MADCKEDKEATTITSTTTTAATEESTETPIARKFDSPEETSDNSANDEAEKLTAQEKESDNSSSSNSMSNNEAKHKAPILSPGRFRNFLGSNASEFASSSKLKPSLLRPSQLNAVTNSAGTLAKSLLQPSKFQNPFLKPDDNTEVNEPDSSVENNSTTEKEVPKQSEKDDDTVKDKEEKKEEKAEDEEEPPKFLAFGKNTKENESSMNSSVAASTSTSSFVFGQNLKERVAVAHDADSSDSSEKEDTKEVPTNENGASELMFSNAAAVCKSTSKPGLTLSEAAHELEEANRASKRKYNEVTLLTGEEDETNVLQINCKLFAFDKATSSWQERGRGSLRLNDRDDESRLVGRAAGTQRLLLNTKIWPGMTAERAGPKSLRITAMDHVQGSDQIRIFVVQAAQKEVEQLHNLLLHRLRRAQERQPKKLAPDNVDDQSKQQERH